MKQQDYWTEGERDDARQEIEEQQAEALAAAPCSPCRIQRKRVKGWKMPPNTVYVGRPTKWGNPFNKHYMINAMGMSPEAAQADVAELFRDCLLGTDEPANPDYAEQIENMKRDIAELRGKNLACWCQPGTPCHADSLLILANRDENNREREIKNR